MRVKAAASTDADAIRAPQISNNYEVEEISQLVDQCGQGLIKVQPRRSSYP